MSYKYKSPEESGYIKVKVNKKKWNKQFKYKNMKFTWKQYLEVYYHPEKGFIVEKYHRTWIKSSLLVVYPIALIVHGIANYKDTNRGCLDVLFQRKYGSFTRDAIYQTSDKYSELLKTIK